ncbi:hypothetical protein HZF08_08750 [Paenibacillus sp. CGMCC 1.16610]|uniref:Endospore appendages core domain-containing protein n=2 Tax=Paenibacillus TaxID=44249 RepID=A0ABU6DFM9_9BACL|nr:MULTISPECIES: S-Ena type endospore appendage [Paenibacillus]MBA2938397.1 hypothetical protein [Paenibacillus sp. CGMCC 1.16610]MCY9658688.1 hypothetical protein [Paenibacillus anseongense]MEB4796087.1 hypothetical protein [Paenibacillus chondroitinus]MVQ37456.1 hypothetical protein [Paenibacillus anseongense]
MPCLCNNRESFNDDICGTFLLTAGMSLTVYAIDSSAPAIPPLPISGSVIVRAISGGNVDVTVRNSIGASIDSFTVPVGSTFTRTYGDIGFVALLNNTSSAAGEYGLSLHY